MSPGSIMRLATTISCISMAGTWWYSACGSRTDTWKKNSIHWSYIYTFQRDTQCSSTDCLLMLRCQLYMFQTVTVHPQELLFRRCMCRLWYVVRNALSDTSRWYNVWGSSLKLICACHHSHIPQPTQPPPPSPPPRWQQQQRTSAWLPLVMLIISGYWTHITVNLNSYFSYFHGTDASGTNNDSSYQETPRH